MDSEWSISELPEVKTIWNKNFICVLIANLMLTLGHFSVNTHVATYATFMGAVPVVMGLLTGMFFGISLLLKPITGPVMTKVDKRLLMIIVFAIGGVSNLGYALFHSIPMFVFFRIINGIQYGFVGGLIMTLASDNLPKEKMASGMGLYGIGGAVGAAVGPSIGHWLYELGTQLKNEDFGYTMIFLFAALMLFLAVIPSMILHPDRKTKEQVASTGVWYKNIVTIHALPTAIVLFFVILAYAIYNSYIFNLGEERGFENISLFYTLMAGTLVLSRPMSGWLADRLGPARVIIPSLLMFTASFLIVGFSKSFGGVLVGGVLAALGIGSSQPTIQAMSMQSVVPLKRSVASNTIYIGIDLGFFLGPLIGSVIYAHTNYAFMFRVMSVPVAIALVCFIIVLPIYKRRVAELERLSQKNKNQADLSQPDPA